MAPLKVLLVFLICLFCAGCAEVKFKVNVGQIDPLKLTFTEDILVSGEAQDYLATLEKPGESDFWHIMRRIALKQGLVLKEKASNHLVLSGSFDEKNAQTIPSFVGEQFMALATGYGATRLSNSNQPLPIKVNVRKQEGVLADTLEITCDYDFSGPSLDKQIKLPQQWEQVFLGNAAATNISVALQAPLKVKATNGKYSEKTNTIIWQLHVGSKERLTATLEQVKIAPVVGMVAALLLGAASLLYFIARRSAAKRLSAQNTRSH